MKLLVSLALFGVAGLAQQPQAMRLEELEKIALANNPTAAQADANVRVSLPLSLAKPGCIRTPQSGTTAMRSAAARMAVVSRVATSPNPSLPAANCKPLGAWPSSPPANPGLSLNRSALES